MESRRFFPALAAAALMMLVSCAGSRNVWTQLTPVDRPTTTSLQKSERSLGGVTVVAELLENKTRYLARIEVRNESRRTVYGPKEVVLKDRDGWIQGAFSRGCRFHDSHPSLA